MNNKLVILLVLSLFFSLQGCTTKEEKLYDELLSKGMCEVFNAKFIDSSRIGTKETQIECSNGLELTIRLLPRDGVKL